SFGATVVGLDDIPQEQWPDNVELLYYTYHIMVGLGTFFIVIMSFVGGLQGGFEQARVMTLGGPVGTTTTLSYYIYTKAFEEFQIGYSSAVAWVLFIVIFGITLVNWRYGSRYVND
ncbi:MAG: cytochrome ubiquinol oxidase subunit I, partial [Candidatus Hydrogenedentes bacterium]|nr:cytochrome ubiquinol oxidase subunit I [Candidatus Hydrogenedentota bacterium]